MILRILNRISSALNLLAATAYSDALKAPKYMDPRHLAPRGLRAYSQNGEDGMIAHLVDVLGIRNHVFLEIGCGDGSENNTRLLLAQGWTGTWIDGSPRNIKRIRRMFRTEISAGQLRTICAIVTPDNINTLISDHAHANPSIVSIDVDRDTHHVWRALDAVVPELTIVEYNAFWRPPTRWETPYIERAAWDGTSIEFGASLETMVEIADDKGYRLVGCDLCGVNAFFVQSQLVNPSLFLEAFDAMTHYEPPRYDLLSPGTPRWR